MSECQAALEQQPRRRPYFFMQPHIIIAYPPTPMRLFLRVMCGLRVGAAAAATAVQVWHVQAGDLASSRPSPPMPIRPGQPFLIAETVWDPTAAPTAVPSWTQNSGA